MPRHRSYLDDNYGSNTGSSAPPASATPLHVENHGLRPDYEPPPTVTRRPSHHSQPSLRPVVAARGRSGRQTGSGPRR